MTSSRRGGCGEIVSHYNVVEKKPVEKGAVKTWIKWLIEREEAPSFAMRIFEVEPGGWIEPHHHPWEHEIYVLDGIGDIRIGSKVYRVTSGSFIYIPPNVEHGYWNRGDGVLRFICVIPVKPTVDKDEKIEC